MTIWIDEVEGWLTVKLGVARLRLITVKVSRSSQYLFPGAEGHVEFLEVSNRTSASVSIVNRAHPNVTIELAPDVLCTSVKIIATTHAYANRGRQLEDAAMPLVSSYLLESKLPARDFPKTVEKRRKENPVFHVPYTKDGKGQITGIALPNYLQLSSLEIEERGNSFCVAQRALGIGLCYSRLSTQGYTPNTYPLPIPHPLHVKDNQAAGHTNRRCSLWYS